jgi:WD40 repeat protein
VRDQIGANGTLDKVTTLEPAHEAVLRQWSLLKGWLAADLARLAALEDAKRAAHDWDANGRDAAWLAHRGLRLADAVALDQRPDLAAKLDPPDREYLAACRAQEAAEAAEVEARRREREEEQARALCDAQNLAAAKSSLARRTRVGLLATSLLAVAAAGAGAYGLLQAGIARQQQALAEQRQAEAVKNARDAFQQVQVTQSQELAARGRSLAKERLDLALLLTLEAYRTAPTPEARTALLESMQYSPYLARFVLPPDSGARTAALSSDGAMIAIATESKSVELRSAKYPERIIATLQAPDVVRSLFFASDDRKLITCYGDDGISVWDIASRTSVDEPAADRASARYCMALSPDRTKLAYETNDKALMLWDVVHLQRIGSRMPAPLTDVHFSGHDKNGKRVEGWDREPVGLNAVAFSPDGNTLAAAYQDWTIVLWDVLTGRRIGEPLKGHTSFVNTVAFSPDGRNLVSGSEDKTLRFWDTATGRAVSDALKGHDDAVATVAFSPDGKEVISAGFNGTLIMWNVGNGAAYAYPLQERLRGHVAPVQTLQWNRESGQILTVASDGSVIFWRDTFQSVSLMQAVNVNSISISRDGDLLASGGFRDVTIWDTRTRAPIRTWASAAEIKGVAISPDRKAVAAADANSIAIWDIGTGRLIARRERPHEIELTDLAYSPSSAIVASSGRDGLIRMWDASDLSPLSPPLQGDKSEVVLHLAFSPDGMTLVSSGRVGLVRFWDVGTRQPDGEPIRADGDVTRVAFSHDGKRLVTGTDRAVVEIWDARSHTREGARIAAKGLVTGVAFSPDGNIFATGNGDGLVRLWDVRDHAALEPAMRAHSSFVNAIAFDPKGQYVAAGAHDGIAVIDLTPQDWALQICRSVGRNLTRAEWAQYIPRQSYRISCPQ